jgi:thioredoxin 1
MPAAYTVSRPAKKRAGVSGRPLWRVPQIKTESDQEDLNMAVMTITKENFQREVLESDRPVLLDFWASWCFPCRMLSPVVDEVAEEHPSVKVGKVNVDEQRELAAMFIVMSIPTLAVVKNGRVEDQLMGVRPKQQIEALIS